jgi:hypothetical protein
MRTLTLLLLTTTAAAAAPPPGADLDSPLHHWFDRQYSVNGQWCCNVSDGHFIADSEWKAGEHGFQVRIGNVWRDVPPEALRDPTRGGPNPTGRAIVWYTPGATGDYTIYCFAPGTMF